MRLARIFLALGSLVLAAAGGGCGSEPPAECEPVTCQLYCEDGFALDPETGCEVCRCKMDD